MVEHSLEEARGLPAAPVMVAAVEVGMGKMGEAGSPEMASGNQATVAAEEQGMAVVHLEAVHFRRHCILLHEVCKIPLGKERVGGVHTGMGSLPLSFESLMGRTPLEYPGKAVHRTEQRPGAVSMTRWPECNSEMNKGLCRHDELHTARCTSGSDNEFVVVAVVAAAAAAAAAAAPVPAVVLFAAVAGRPGIQLSAVSLAPVFVQSESAVTCPAPFLVDVLFPGAVPSYFPVRNVLL